MAGIAAFGAEDDINPDYLVRDIGVATMPAQASFRRQGSRTALRSFLFLQAGCDTRRGGSEATEA